MRTWYIILNFILEIIEYTITKNSKFIVIASDGVWEFLSNEEIMNFVIPYYKTMNAIGASERLVDEALKTWRAVLIFKLKYLI